jgi:uncharacterized protein
MTLAQYLVRSPPFALAFSGGTDSVCLLAAARKAGADVRPYYVASPFQPAFEFDAAREAAAFLDVPLSILRLPSLDSPEIAANGPDRCYHCKHRVFSAILGRARTDGYTVLADGTNASDNPAERPGMRALAELGVVSPLRECGLTGSDVRTLLAELGLDRWNRPSYSCLATRIPAGVAITQPLLERIERAETFLLSRGYSGFRCRHDGRTAWLELARTDMARLAAERRDVLDRLRSIFDCTILLDLKARDE